MGSSADSRYYVCKKCFGQVDLHHDSVDDHVCDNQDQESEWVPESEAFLDDFEKLIKKSTQTVVVMARSDQGYYSTEKISFVNPNRLIRELKKLARKS